MSSTAEPDGWDGDLGAQAPAGAVDSEDAGRRSASRVRQRPSRALSRRPASRASRPSPSVHYGSVAEWVEQWLLPMYTRGMSADRITWCPEWWRHPEVVARLTALWLAWEHLRLDPGTGMSSWWRDHADHHLPAIMDSDGMLRGCKPQGHTRHPLAALPSTPPPAGLFD